MSPITLILFLVGGLVCVECISRQTVAQRANDWVSKSPAWDSESRLADITGRKYYRTDCSGFVSMAWNMRGSYGTANLPRYSYSINKDQLKMGDILLKIRTSRTDFNGHVILFKEWYNSDKSQYVAWELAGSGMYYGVKTYPSSNSGYNPYRYKSIKD